MTQEIQHNFAPGTVLLAYGELDDDGERERVVGEAMPGSIHHYAPDGALLTVILDDDDKEVGEDWLYPDEVIRVLESPVSVPVVSEDEQFNRELALFAGEHDATLVFTYQKSPRKPSELRRVVPEHVLDARGKAIIVGYSPERDDIRSFRIDRIVDRAGILGDNC